MVELAETELMPVLVLLISAALAAWDRPAAMEARPMPEGWLPRAQELFKPLLMLQET